MAESNACDENMPTPPLPPIAQPQTPRRKLSVATNSVDQYSPAAACPLTPRPAPVRAFDVAQNVAASSPSSETDAVSPKTFFSLGKPSKTPCVEKVQRDSIAANHSLNPVAGRKFSHHQRRNESERERKHQELLEMAERELKEAYPVAKPKADEEQECSMWPYPDPSLPASTYKVFCNRFSFNAPSRRTQGQYTPNISPRGSVSRPNANTSDEDMVKRPRRRVDSTDAPVTPKQTRSLPDTFGASKPIDIPSSPRTFNDLPRVNTSPNSLDSLPPLVPSTYEPHPGTPVDFSHSPTRKPRTPPLDYHTFLEKTRLSEPPIRHRRFLFDSQANKINKINDEAVGDVKHERASKQARILGLATYNPRTARAATMRERDSTYMHNPPGEPDIWIFESPSPTLRKTTGRMNPPSLTHSLSTSPGVDSERNSMTSETNSASTSEQEGVRSRCARNSGRANASTGTSVSSTSSARDSSADKFLRHVRASKEARAAAKKEKEKKKSDGGIIVVVGAGDWADWVDMDPL
ncbi:hypothetical protein BKA63DRAFT_560531 [Paraphoma chrysanthemicola]|nr:hypothetical protein BKA63DRAFT_560531 [Paraphoma chrysanthemicola]